MIDFAEILPYIFMLIGFITMVLVARYLSTNQWFVCISFLFVYIYRREVFTDDRTNISISQTAQNIPVDRINSPYTLNMEENRSTLKGRHPFKNDIEWVLMFIRWSLYSTSYRNSLSVTCILVCKYSTILFGIRFKRFSIIFIWKSIFKK